MTLHFFTFTHDLNAGPLSIIKNSCWRNGIDMNYLGDGLGKFTTARKLSLLEEKLAELDDNDIVCAVDGFDVYFSSGPAEIEKRFLAMDCDCVVSAERAYSHQYPNYREFYDQVNASGPYRYVNTGSVIGYVGTLKKMYKSSWSMRIQSKIFTARNINKAKHYLSICAKFLKLRNFHPNSIYTYIYYTDQQHIGRFIARNSGKYKIRLDYDTKLFWCCAFEWDDIEAHYYVKNGKLFNVHTNRDPVVVHVPGWRVHRGIFVQLYKVQNSMKKPVIDLVLSTPDGAPQKLVDYLYQDLFSAGSSESGGKLSEIIFDIGKLHDWVLQSHQKAWYQMGKWENGIDLTHEQKLKCQEIVDGLPYNCGTAVNDSRLSYLAPIWMEKLKNPVLIFCYSDPMSCAVSLQRKWRFPLNFGLALWEYYVLSAARQLDICDYLLFSIPKLRESPDKYLQTIQSRYYEICGQNHGQANPIVSDSLSELISLVPSAPEGISESEFQREIFEDLEDGNLDKIRRRQLSKSAEDILFQYGNLRAGYDLLKSENQVGEDPSIQSDEKENLPVESTIPSEHSNEMIREIVVHIKGMDPQTFYSMVEDPIFDALTNALQNQSKRPGEIVYIECGDSENTGMYFSAADLIGVEYNLVEA